MLLTRGVDVLRVDGYSSTPLYYAVCNKDKNMALLLLRAGADQEFKKTIGRRGVAHTSFLETAIMNKNLDMTRLLLGHGATSKLHPKPKRRAMRGCLHNGQSALHTAVTYSTPAIAKLLLERGARANAVTWRSEAPFHAVVCRDNNGTLALNIAKRALVEVLLQHCADPKLQDENSDTAFHNSIRNGYFETSKLLLKAGAKCKIPGARFGTVVDLTIRDCTLEWTELIIDHVHGFDIRGEDGTVTLFRALEKADCERAQVLLARGVLVTATSKNRETPLHFALRTEKSAS